MRQNEGTVYFGKGKSVIPQNENNGLNFQNGHIPILRGFENELRNISLSENVEIRRD